MEERFGPRTLVGIKKNKLTNSERLARCAAGVEWARDFQVVVGFLCCCWSLGRSTLRTSVLFTSLWTKTLLRVL